MIVVFSHYWHIIRKRYPPPLICNADRLPILYLSNVLITIIILFECFELKLDTFLSWFCVQIRYFLLSLDEILILLELRLEAISKNFQMFWVEIRYFSNVLDPRHILFNVFVYKYETFWRFWVKRRHFPNMLERISIHVELFGDKTRYFSNVLGRN